MEVKASLRFARIGTQKARLVANLVRGQHVEKALKQLIFLKPQASKDYKKAYFIHTRKC